MAEFPASHVFSSFTNEVSDSKSQYREWVGRDPHLVKVSSVTERYDHDGGHRWWS